jgi:meiotically up-regulated gene 157 (Mug157) protein
LPLEQPTGVFFGEQTAESLLEAVTRFERNASLFDPVNCRQNAERFSTENFKTALTDFIDARLLRSSIEQLRPYLVRERTAEERHLASMPS